MEGKMSNMNFNCDVCGREVYGCTFVNGMKFCAKCYQETFGETEKDRKIADLQSQLAEKEKEIEYQESMKILAVKNQNQKAIEQLEKVKEVVKHFCELHSDEFYGVKSQVMGIKEDVFEFIDQQINELKVV